MSCEMILGLPMENTYQSKNGNQILFLKKKKLKYSIVWVCLPQLLTAYYDGVILKIIGNPIGKLLKIRACTGSTLRRYARLWVYIPIDEPVLSCIHIGTHQQSIHYEG